MHSILKIVVVTSRFPYPIEKGDKLRAFHHIKALSKHHEVYLVSISHDKIALKDLEAVNSYCADLKVFKIGKIKLYLNILSSFIKGLPLMVGYFYDSGMKQKIHNHILEIDPDHIYSQLIRSSEYVRSLPFPKTLDYMDVFSVGMVQRAKTASWPMSWLFNYESKLLAKYEQLIYPDFDHHCIISEQDKNRLKVSFKDHILVLPNGVDASFFKALEIKPEYDLVFVGNMGYLPNIEAAEFLVNEVLPRLKRKLPHLKILIAGARPSPRVKQLGGPNVIISGWVDDIRSAYSNGRIFLAPIFSGMGQQNKILEAMAMEMACVTSEMVNNAIGAENGKEIYVANSAVQMCLIIEKVLGDQDQLSKVGKAARNYILENYSWEYQNKKLNGLVGRKPVLQSV